MPVAKQVLKFKYGTQAAYTAAIKDLNTIYFTTDSNRLFVGETEYSRPVQHGTSLPEGYAPANSLFVLEAGTARTLYYSKDGATWEIIAKLPATIAGGVFGNNTAGAVAFGGTIKVPKVTVDDRGFVTAAEEVEVTLPDKPADIKNTSTTSGEGNAVTAVEFGADGHTLTVTKGETFATKKELTDAVGKITSFDIDSNGGTGYASLAALKEAHPEGTKGVFYLVVNTDASTDNAFIEYFWTGTAYEMAGKFGEVDTSDLATKTELSDGLATKVDKTTTVNGQALSGNVTITDITGNAGTADKLKTGVKINGVDFDGSKDITIAVGSASLEGLTDTTITNAAAGNSLVYDGATSKWINKTLTKADVGLGNVDNTADANKNVASAGKLTTARTINFIGDDATGSVEFDGSADVNVTLDVKKADAADTATKATQDASGNVIEDTYATKTELANSALVWETI